MSNILLGTLATYWQNVSDWVTGVSSSKPVVKIDQTTDGTTNRVVAKISQVAGENLISFGNITTMTHSVAPVTTGTGVALASNANRKYALLINDSANDQYIKFNANAVMNQGIRINANGGSYEISTANNNLYTGAINVISSASGNLLVTEGV